MVSKIIASGIMLFLMLLLIYVYAEIFRTENTPKPKFFIQKLAYFITNGFKK